MKPATKFSFHDERVGIGAAFGRLKPGAYRVEAALSGWTKEKFTDAERSELARMASPFLTGEVQDSILITLTTSGITLEALLRPEGRKFSVVPRQNWSPP